MATFEVGEIIGNQEGGTPTTLFVTVNTDATTPILYQWLRNGIAIPGAVDATYNFIILPEDSYATYTVFVQNPCGQETSLPSTVGVVSPTVFCKQYECDVYSEALLALNPVWYYPMNRAEDLADYPNPVGGIKDYSIYGNDTFSASVNPPTVTVAPEDGLSINNCSGNLTFFNTQLNGGTGTSVVLDSRFATINEWPQSTEYTYLVSPQGNYNSDFGAFRNEIDSGGRWTGCRLYCSVDGVTMNLFLEIEGFNSYSQSVDMTTLDPDWNNKVIGYRTTYSGNTTTMELLLDFAGTGVTCGGSNSLIFGQIYPGPQHIYSTGLFSNGKMQESALFNSALTDETLLSLKDAWLQNLSTYVDPNPNCTPVP